MALEQMSDTRPIHYTDEMLSALADKYRPRFSSHSVRAAKKAFYPARRHRCVLCDDIFECGICTITADHILHITHGGHIPLIDYACECCIEKYELWIAVTTNTTKGRYGIYDHLTGELIGQAQLPKPRPLHYERRPI